MILASPAMGEPERVPGRDLSPRSFFTLLGVKPVLGRTLVTGEDQVGAAPVAIISTACGSASLLLHRMWSERR